MPADPLEAARLRATLSAYRYSSPTKSLLERVCLVRLWNALAERLPRNFAPNALTLSGFAAAVVAWVLIMCFSPDLSGSLPTTWYPLVAVLLVVYQTMDGCDGPQARRLKCGSALGELTDHGVDAVVTTLDILVLVEILGYSLSAGPGVLVAILGGHLAFLLSNMTLLHLGRQQFQEIDCQEAQIVIQLMLLACWLYYDVLGAEARGLPTQLGQTPVPLPGFAAAAAAYLPGAAAHQVAEATADSYASFELRWVFLVAGAVASTGGNTVTMLGRILRKYFFSGGGSDPAPVAAEGEETVGPGLLLRQTVTGLVWCGAVALSWFLVRGVADTGVWPLWMVMVSLGFGSLALNSLVIRVTRKPLPPLARTPALLIVAAWCVLAYAVPLVVPDNVLALWCALAVPAAAAMMQEVDYAMRVASEIADALDIPFWTVPKPKA